MSSRNRNRRKPNNEKPNLLRSLTDLSFEEIDALMKAAPMAFQSKIQASLNSSDTKEIMKANMYLGKIEPNSPKIQSVFFDPNDLAGNGKGYKDAKGVVSFEVLRRMSDIYIIRAIVNTRIEQIQNFLHFSQDNQKEGFTIRKKKGLFKDDKDESISKQDKAIIEKIVKFLDKGGFNEKWDNIDSFQEFVRKIAFDSLTLDQVAFELVRNRSWELQKFRAVDASLIRYLDSVDPRQREAFESYRFKGYLPRYCMIWQDQILRNPVTEEAILYYPWELGFGIRNKSTNIRKNGYGTSELETLVEIVTWILWGMQYNGNFFSQGSQPKGFINIRNGNISNSTLNEFRQAWTQTMRGVQNCLVGSTKIVTDSDGLISLEDCLGNEESKETRIWTGDHFENGRVYRVGLKKRCTMRLDNGMYVESSPNHRFKVVSDDGIIEWKERRELKIGDYVLCNKKPVDKVKTLFYNGKEVGEDLFEIFGWMTGDGYFGEDENKKRRCSLFYHQEKEQDILKRHQAILDRYGINNSINVQERSEEERKRIAKKYGFKSVAKEVVRISICDSNFFRFLMEIGFTPSHDGKTIPQMLFQVGSEKRCAFLKGFFSADGSIVQEGTGVRITISSDSLRNQTRMLLIMEGIQCSRFEYRSTALRKCEKEGIHLIIKDKKEFYDRIGFLQAHKQYTYQRTQSYCTTKSLHPAMARLEAKKMRVELFRRFVFEEGSRIADNKATTELTKISKGQDPCTYQKLENLAEKYDYELPSDYKIAWFSPIVELTETNEEVEMFDVEIYDNIHQFVAEGTFSHNSHRVPVINGIDLEWIDLQKGNKEMEFNEWLKFLIVIGCAVYRMDPSELGFQFKDQAQIFGQDGQKQRLQHSREKGLKPILIFLENVITKYIVEEIDENFEFAFTGIDIDDESAQVELDKKKLEMGAVPMQDMFLKYTGREFDEENDIILNQVYQTAKSMQQQQEMFGASVPGESEEEGVEGEGDPFADYEKSFGDNPILGPALEYYKKNLWK